MLGMLDRARVVFSRHCRMCRRGRHDVEGEVIASRSRAVAHKFLDGFRNGNGRLGCKPIAESTVTPLSRGSIHRWRHGILWREPLGDRRATRSLPTRAYCARRNEAFVAIGEHRRMTGGGALGRRPSGAGDVLRPDRHEPATPCVGTGEDRRELARWAPPWLSMGVCGSAASEPHHVPLMVREHVVVEGEDIPRPRDQRRTRDGALAAPRRSPRHNRGLAHVAQRQNGYERLDTAPP